MRQRLVILASGSPRRKELLERMGLEFEIRVSGKEEVQNGDTPEQIVEGLSRQKAQDVAEQAAEGNALVIGADTIVVCDGQIMGKPCSEEEACRMIERLQGRTHQVYTGVTVTDIDNGRKNKISYDTFSCCTQVKVFPMEEKEIRRYVALGESMDKAGAYGIQGGFGMYVERIEGDYNNVLGLPISALYQKIKNKINF